MDLEQSDIERAERYRKQKSTAVLAVMFTDIVGSTALREDMGEVRYEELRESHEAAVAEIIHRDTAGAIVKGTGDGVLAVFAEPSTGVERALEIRVVMRTQRPIRLRVGIDMGQVSTKIEGGIVKDVLGRHVNGAARISALAEGGHVLVSFPVYDCAVGWLKGEDIEWLHHDRISVKGFAKPISVHEPFDPRLVQPQDVAPGPVARHEEGATVLEQPPNILLRESSVFYAIRAAPESPHDVQAWERRIRQSVDAGWTGRVLWVDDYPQHNDFFHRALRSSGCTIDVALTTTEAQNKLTSLNYSLMISDVGRGDDPKAGINLLNWMKQRNAATPAIIFTSPTTAMKYRALTRRLGAVACTSGGVSLLKAIASTAARP